MWGKLSLAFVVAAIGGMMLPITEVDAQSTFDDSASCDSSTLYEAVNLVRADLEETKRIREDLKDMKNLLGSNQQQCPQTDLSDSKQAIASYFLCAYTWVIWPKLYEITHYLMKK